MFYAQERVSLWENSGMEVGNQCSTPRKSEYVGSFGHGSRKSVFCAQKSVNMWEVLGVEARNQCSTPKKELTTGGICLRKISC